MSNSLLRRLRRCLALVLPIVFAFAQPASADDIECIDVWERFAALVRHEVHSGLTIEVIDQINGMIPIVEACIGGTLGAWDSGVDRWGPLVAAYFRPEDVDQALCLMALESAGDPGAKNPSSGASGLMQVMPFWAGHFGYPTSALFDPFVNLEVAAAIRDKQGWGAWTPYLRGSCR